MRVKTQTRSRARTCARTAGGTGSGERASPRRRWDGYRRSIDPALPWLDPFARVRRPLVPPEQTARIEERRHRRPVDDDREEPGALGPDVEDAEAGGGRQRVLGRVAGVADELGPGEPRELERPVSG